MARHGAVATDDGRCSRIGMDVIRDGGHAVDATVAAALCLGVVSPASSGIGGGAFMLLRLANGLAQAFDMRETAPLQASKVPHGDVSLNALYDSQNQVFNSFVFSVFRTCMLEILL